MRLYINRVVQVVYVVQVVQVVQVLQVAQVVPVVQSCRLSSDFTDMAWFGLVSAIRVWFFSHPVPSTKSYTS